MQVVLPTCKTLVRAKWNASLNVITTDLKKKHLSEMHFKEWYQMLAYTVSWELEKSLAQPLKGPLHHSCNIHLNFGSHRPSAICTPTPFLNGVNSEFIVTWLLCCLPFAVQTGLGMLNGWECCPALVLLERLGILSSFSEWLLQAVLACSVPEDSREQITCSFLQVTVFSSWDWYITCSDGFSISGDWLVTGSLWFSLLMDWNGSDSAGDLNISNKSFSFSWTTHKMPTSSLDISYSSNCSWW